MNKATTGLLATAIATAMGSLAHAACPVDGATPFYAADALPDVAGVKYTGFSQYVTGSDGLALELCLNEQLCFFDPVIPDNPLSVKTGFGGEGFWWSADSSVLSSDGGVDGLIVMATEAAYLNGDPAPNEQFPFTRLRMRVDVAQPGIYTITHPFGQEVYEITEPGRRAINDSFDIEFAPGQINQGRVGPWLVWDTFPNDPALDTQPGHAGADFVGDINTPHAVTGSPCGTNFFRISATAFDGTPLVIDAGDLDGDGSSSSLTESLFSVQGAVYTGNTAKTPLAVGGVTYSRNGGGVTRLNAHAVAPTTATVDLVYDNTIIPLSRNEDRFFASTVMTSAPPSVVQVVAENPAKGNQTNTEDVVVKDLVRILSATYNVAAQELAITAESSDVFSDELAGIAAPSLTVEPFGVPLVGGKAVINVVAAPSAVTVTSDRGGAAEAAVQVVP